MSNKQLLIIGTGGHAKVVLHALLQMNVTHTIHVADDNPQLAKQQFAGFTIHTPVDTIINDVDLIHVAIGDNPVRENYFTAPHQKKLFTIIHPSAVLADKKAIANGCFIAANAIIAPDAIIKEACIINHASVVDHDCQIGAFTHIAPNATLGGNVIVGKNCLIGAGAVILPGIQIGDGVVVAAGAVVTKNVAANTTVKGVPAQ